MTDLNQKIEAKFLTGTSYEFNVEQHESLWFMGKDGQSFSNSYSFSIKQLEENLFEAFYPNTVFSQVKEFDQIKNHLSTNPNLKSKSLFYTINEEHEIHLKNLKELKRSGLRDLEILSALLTEEEFEDVDFWIEHIFESTEKIHKYILRDIAHIYYCDQLKIEDDYYIDLTKDDGLLQNLAKRTLQLFNLNFDECSLFRFLSSGDNSFEISLFRSKNALTSLDRDYQGIDFEGLKSDFFFDQFNFDILQNGTYSIHNYDISKGDHILEEYESNFKIDSKKMRKEINYKLSRTPHNKM